MKVYYDTEFLEDGKTIELISIGMVAEDSREYYAVNRDAPWRRIKKNDWLMTNVVPGLPKAHGDERNHQMGWLFNRYDPCVKTKHRIAEEVRVFLQDVTDLELWAWYGAYDHVALAQLWGRMIDLPPGVPMWTNDLRQEVARLGDPPLPKQGSGLHNALADARHLKVMDEVLRSVRGGEPR